MSRHAARHLRPAIRVLLAAAPLVPLSPPATAQDLFSITAVGAGGAVTASDSNLLDLIEDAVETRGAFNSLGSSGFTATARYADVENAIVITVNAAQTQATLSFPGTGFSQTFSGFDADDLEDEIEAFIEEDGGAAYAAFLASLNAQSLLSILDGNPFSSTALANEQLFDTWGLGAASPRQNAGRVGAYGTAPSKDDPLDAGYVIYDVDGEGVDISLDRDTGTYRHDYGDGWFAITPQVHGFDAAGFNGGGVSVGFSAGWWFAHWVGVAVGGSVQTNDFDGTTSFHSNVNFAVPLRPIDTLDDRGFGVALGLTPFVVSGVGGSIEAAAGGAFNGYGGAASLTLGLGSVQIQGAAQYIDFRDQDLDFGQFEFDTQLNQSALTLGGTVRVFLDGPGGNWWIDGGLTYVEYQDAAAVPDWLRPEVGVGWRWGNDSRVRVAYRGLIAETDDGRDFDAASIAANVVIGF